MTQINRKLHEALGLKPLLRRCKCGCEQVNEYYPDYCDDPRLVIEAMQQREDWPEFLGQVGYITVENGYGTTIWKEYVRVDLILDKTGKLALLAIGWVETQARKEFDNFKKQSALDKQGQGRDY